MPSHLHVWRRNIPPAEEVRQRCAVCRFPLDPDRTRQPETSPTTYTVTGTNYFSKTASGEIDLVSIDKLTTPTVGSYSACPFCGSGSWADGAPGPLRR
jgi:hypothetical protein